MFYPCIRDFSCYQKTILCISQNLSSNTVLTPDDAAMLSYSTAIQIYLMPLIKSLLCDHCLECSS